MDELELDTEQLGIEHPHGLLEQLLAGLVALEDDDLQGVRHGRGGYPRLPHGPGEPELLGVRLQRRDHERHVLVEVDPEPLGAFAHRLAVDLAANAGVFIFFLTDFGVRPSIPCGRT